ncbi:MAG TPA: formyl transferase, partial [Pararhizobium sp.]|uniref:formyl transferase n=1 Tax=Pararhizobium sp. TaxID=1977563 RepID=UPI002C6D06D7
MTPAANKIILVVTAGGRNPQILINAVAARFGDVAVLQEQQESKATFVKRRARKLGWITAIGQLATMIASRLGKRFTEQRADDIIRDYGVSDRIAPSIPTTSIESINSQQAIRHIHALLPSVILLVSCRMLSPATLAAMPCPVINFHAGINPQYRGLMGGYWARVEDDEENFGATVHLVDAGVDTGGILYQTRMKPSKSDTMHTYPLLQTAASTDIVVKAVDDALSGALKPLTTNGTSRQWYH